MEKALETLQKEYDEATVKVEQYRNKSQRLKNRIRDYQQGGVDWLYTTSTSHKSNEARDSLP